jgi:hypothetical protein
LVAVKVVWAAMTQQALLAQQAVQVVEEALLVIFLAKVVLDGLVKVKQVETALEDKVLAEVEVEQQTLEIRVLEIIKQVTAAMEQHLQLLDLQ